MSIYRWMYVGLGVVICREAVSQPCPRWIRDISRPGIGGAVEDLTTFDSPTGTVLVAGGFFRTAGTSPAQFVAQWNGVNWQSLGLGTDGVVHAVEQFDDGSGPVLIAGGEFSQAGFNPRSKHRSMGWDSVDFALAGRPGCHRMGVEPGVV